MIDQKTFERLTQIIALYGDVMLDRVGSQKERDDLRAECEQADKDIAELEAFWRKRR